MLLYFAHIGHWDLLQSALVCFLKKQPMTNIPSARSVSTGVSHVDSPFCCFVLFFKHISIFWHNNMFLAQLVYFQPPF